VEKAQVRCGIELEWESLRGIVGGIRLIGRLPTYSPSRQATAVKVTVAIHAASRHPRRHEVSAE
jgi:hypothetical protein